MTISSDKEPLIVDVNVANAPEYRNDRDYKSAKRVTVGALGAASVAAAGALMSWAEHRPNESGVNSWASHVFSPEFIRTVTPDRLVDASIGITGLTVVYGLERIVAHLREKKVYGKGWNRGVVEGSISTIVAIEAQRNTDRVDNSTVRPVLFDQDIPGEPDQGSLNEVFDQSLPLSNDQSLPEQD